MGQKDKNTNGITDLLESRDIKSMIYTIRGQQVMLDSDLALLYQTFNQVINRYIGAEEIPKFAYIPCGHTNSFANSLGIPQDTEAAIDTLLKGKAYRCDTGKVNGHIFNYVAAYQHSPAILHCC